MGIFKHHSSVRQTVDRANKVPWEHRKEIPISVVGLIEVSGSKAEYWGYVADFPAFIHLSPPAVGDM